MNYRYMQQPLTTSQIVCREARFKRLHCKIPFIQHSQKDRTVWRMIQEELGREGVNAEGEHEIGSWGDGAVLYHA